MQFRLLTSEIVASKSASESEISREVKEPAHQLIVQKLAMISFSKLTFVIFQQQKTTVFWRNRNDLSEK